MKNKVKNLFTAELNRNTVLPFFFQKLQILFVILICYNIIFTHINLVKLEGFLVRFLPAIVVRWYVRSMSVYQKTSLNFLIVL